MLHNSKNLYLIKIDDNIKYGLVRSGIVGIQDLINLDKSIRSNYFIAKKIGDKIFLINKTRMNGNKIYVNTKFVKVVKEISLNNILSKAQKYYTNKQLLEIETWINNSRKDFKDSFKINGEPTRKS